MIEAKKAWNIIESPNPEAETSIKITDDKTARIKDAKTRTIIIGYCGQEALSRIFYLRTAKKQWEELERSYLPLGRQQLSTAL